jgi:hypothetical protein
MKEHCLVAQLMLKFVVDKAKANRKTVRSTGAVTVMALALLLAAPAVEAAEPEQPRLKYRGKGLACTCASGTSEEDIRKAWDARFPESEGSRLDSLDGFPATRDEQRRRVDEAQPR